MGSFPDETVQGLLASQGFGWWEEDQAKTLVRGRLIIAYVHHVDLVPRKLVVEGRNDPTDHHSALIKVVQGSINDIVPKTQLPVAALPQYKGEHLIVNKAKARPCVVLSALAPEVEEALTAGRPGWQTAPTITVAPYYGALPDGGKRSGFGEKLIHRIKAAHYPQFVWDRLPISGSEESVLRLDHMMPVGRHHNSYKLTKYKLSEHAIALLDEWIVWNTRGVLNTKGDLLVYRDLLGEL